MEHILNHIELCGRLSAPPELSHENHGRRFYSFFLEVERLSGAVDRLRVLCPEEQLAEVEAADGAHLAVSGQIRSFNLRSESGRRLLISVFAEAIVACDGPPENHVQLTGTLCKPPVYRCTPLGREICDGMLAVNRPYHRSDYLPCIFWGRMAQQVAELAVGTTLSLTGRLQSRDYIKQLETGSERRTAYEISATELETVEL